LCAEDAGINTRIFVVFCVDIFVVEELVFVDKWGDKVWTGGSILHPVFTSEHFNVTSLLLTTIYTGQCMG
jgi:hypothetical protein